MSDIQSFRLCGSHVAVAFGGGFHVFGSGNHSAYAEINGKPLTRTMCAKRGWKVSSEENGFVGHLLALIPFPEFLALDSVAISGASYPGGSFSSDPLPPKEWVEAYRRRRGNKRIALRRGEHLIRAHYRDRRNSGINRLESVVVKAAKRLGLEAREVCWTAFVSKDEYRPELVFRGRSASWKMVKTGEKVTLYQGDALMMPKSIKLP